MRFSIRQEIINRKYTYSSFITVRASTSIRVRYIREYIRMKISRVHCSTHRINCSLVNPDTVPRVSPGRATRLKYARNVSMKRAVYRIAAPFVLCREWFRPCESPTSGRRGWAAMHLVTSGDVAFPRDNASELSFPATLSRKTATFFYACDCDVTALISNINKNGHNGERNYNMVSYWIKVER